MSAHETATANILVLRRIKVMVRFSVRRLPEIVSSAPVAAKKAMKHNRISPLYSNNRYPAWLYSEMVCRLE